MAATRNLRRLVTVAVSPRERHYSLIPSLISLFATIPPDVRVIVAQGNMPGDLRHSLNELRSLRYFDLIDTDFPLYPQEARNLCLEQATSEFIVLADNDIEYEQGWLEAIVGNALENDADVVAPLIFIGPPRATTIHHAGGRIRLAALPGGLLSAREDHMFSNKKIDEVDVRSIGVANDTVEFHCFLARTSYLVGTGGFDERLTTQEQVHFGLLARNLGAKVTFEANARVTYSAKKVFTPKDLHYLSFRWNDAQALDAMRAIKAMWGIHMDEEAMLTRWIRPHRVRAYGTFYQRQLEQMPGKLFFTKVVMPLEAVAVQQALELRQGKELKFTNPIDVATQTETLNSFRMAAE